MVSHIFKFTKKCHSQTIPSSEQRQPVSGNVSAPYADKQSAQTPSNYHKVQQGNEPQQGKMEGYPNLAKNGISNSWSGDSQHQKTFLAPSADKQTLNYDTECSEQSQKCIFKFSKKYHSHRLSHPRSQGQETFSTPYADKETHNYDTEWLNHHLSQSP